MISNKIRVGVIGLGYLGKFHYQKYKLNRSVNLTSVVDQQIENLDFIDSKKIIKTDKYANIIENVDAVSIVTPTNTHYKIAKFFLENKKHVLLEKPMTETVIQANKLNSLAKRNKCILQIGHLEQFNPAVKKLKQSFKNPQFIEVHRLCQFNPRANDVDVVLDLMIHDIDIVMSLVKKRIKKISVSGKKIITDLTDIANVRIEFSDNIIANLTASRISTKNERKMRIFSKKAYYSIDFINSELKQLIKNDKNKFITKVFKFKKADSLKEEINNFINTCYGKDISMTDGVAGENALKVAKRITKGF
ncbi:MAG: Gfo/Idh/MocA family oxidoreductase [Gammaproteobacteria bacterium]|nr:Gfo/Idh/MocA family oxidoreductase [Gammaproteobacteria bacterium]MBL6819036.1 Gfo/Idh/MocA family oxidoreductase [Gammaproteobacteria bacterium]MBL6899128.1 Gfo/Idh/MocA family oxidoreductase [Gammaproteobacteria bacterium]